MLSSKETCLNCSNFAVFQNPFQQPGLHDLLYFWHTFLRFTGSDHCYSLNETKPEKRYDVLNSNLLQGTSI